MAGHVPDGDRERAGAEARAGWHDPEPAVRATALGALARLGQLVAADLEDAAGDPSEVVRARAAELAVHVGAPAAPWLVRALEDASPQVVEAACFGLGEVGDGLDAGEAAGVVEALAGVAGAHPDPLCREAAVAAIGAIASGVETPLRAGLPAVLAALSDKPAVRRRAVLALSAFDGPEVEAALVAARADRDWQVRQAAEDLTTRR